MRKINIKNKKGIAIAIVLVFCMAMLGLVTILVKNSMFQENIHSRQYDRARALMAARIAMQLAIYKFRVLASEFYEVNKLKKANAPNANSYYQAWMSDFDTSDPKAPAKKIKSTLNGMETNDLNYDFGVDDFKIVSKTDDGYNKDYLQIKTWGKYGEYKKVLQELIEVEIAE